MNKVFYLAVLALAVQACQKHEPVSAYHDNSFSVSVDPAMGWVVGSVRDTFLIRVNDENNLHAVPLVYNLAVGATASSGGRKEGIWRDTLDLTPNNVKSITVVSHDGTVGRYAIAFQYVVENHPFPAELKYSVPNQLFFDGNFMYVATSHGLLRSSDDGATFTLLSNATDPSWGDVTNCVYAKGDLIYVGVGNGLAISRDGGKSFTRHTDILPSGVGIGVYGVYVQGDILYMGTYDGFAISRDGGVTFDTTAQGIRSTPNETGVWTVFAMGNTVYAGTQTGLYTSQDGGRNFDFNDNLVKLGGFGVRVNRIFGLNGQLYAATMLGVSSTPDGGQHFKDIHVTTSLGQAASGQDVGGYDSVVVAAVGNQLMMSSDYGNKYTFFSAATGVGAFVSSVTMKGYLIYAGSQGGVSVMRNRQ